MMRTKETIDDVSRSIRRLIRTMELGHLPAPEGALSLVPLDEETGHLSIASDDEGAVSHAAPVQTRL